MLSMSTHARVLVVTLILIAAFALLGWMRSDNAYDFDLRSILPFMRGRGVTLHDWGALALILLGVWGIRRLCRPTESKGDSSSPSEWYEDVDDFDADV
jgi:hypothetical protein